MSRGLAIDAKGMTLFGPVTHVKRVLPVLVAYGNLDFVKPRDNSQKNHAAVGIMPTQWLPNQRVVLGDGAVAQVCNPAR